MATRKNTDNKKVESNTDSLWRKPITLDEDESGDPLASLYQGREVSTQNAIIEPPIQPTKEETTERAENKPKKPVKPKVTVERKKTPKVKEETAEQVKETDTATTLKMTESDLKKVLKIKSENFEFTDIREILRGKSLDMYVYLRHLAGETGICKIKHLDLMKMLDISRPTLFKQGDWLTTLSLIEKRNVPGDHFGTSYTVYRFEDVLPVSDSLKKQLELHLEHLNESNK